MNYDAVAQIIREEYDPFHDEDPSGRVINSCTVALESVVIGLSNHFAAHDETFDKAEFHRKALGHTDALIRSA